MLGGWGRGWHGGFPAARSIVVAQDLWLGMRVFGCSGPHPSDHSWYSTPNCGADGAGDAAPLGARAAVMEQAPASLVVAKTDSGGAEGREATAVGCASLKGLPYLIVLRNRRSQRRKPLGDPRQRLKQREGGRMPRFFP